MKTLLLYITTIMIIVYGAITPCRAEFYPDGGEELMANKEYIIKWDADYFGTDEVLLSIWMYKESVWRTIGSGNSIQGTYKWRVPYIQGDKFRMKVQSKRDPSKMIMSTTYFNIKIENNGGGQPIDPIEGGVVFEVNCNPSPARSTAYCTWNSPDAIGISVYAVTGERLYYHSILTTTYHVIDCSHWANGTFIIEVIFTDGKRKVGKLLKVDA